MNHPFDARALVARAAAVLRARRAFSLLSLAAALPAFALADLAAQGVHADRVVAFDDRGGLGGGIFDPQNALGAPDGALGVHSLGVGGFLTLGFPVVVVDGPGADLVVTENPFRSASRPDETFAEVAFVEVSSNGVDFARIPSRYTGPQVDPGPFAFTRIGHYDGLVGVLPRRTGAADPRDLVATGGDAIDLATLRGHPLVRSGAVDLNGITQVRLVDVRSGIDADARGVSIRDAGGGSADIDAVTVLQHRGSQSASGPTVDLRIPADGRFELTLGDPDGLLDLDPASVGVAIWGLELGLDDLLAIAPVTAASSTSFTVRLGAPLPPALRLQMSASVADLAGNRVGASATRR